MGFELVDGVAHLTDPVALMTNPAAVVAFGHVATSSLVVGAVSAYHLIRRGDPHGVFGRGVRYTAITMVLTSELVAVFGGMQFGYFGDPPTSGLAHTAEEVEAIEAASGGGLVQAANSTSEILMFTVYALMFPIGPTMLLGWLVSRWVRGLRRQKWLLAPLLAAPVLPYAASIAGWVFRETNRQPWVVVHHLTTAEAVTPMSPGTAAASFGFFTAAFAVLAAVTYWLLVRYARRGPGGGPLAEHRTERPDDPGEPGGPREPATPVHTF
ncbi:cytochrome bd-type quinol oxidase subunit 1 [Nocardiopsis arvandica]|uniref:Cytochrome bd-type quinol oxidase subunit 1 n=1 Tax=Nocardiopsis sinuspersici TaxID=501010 RepID=A0A7Y9X984_9ACTN|nr:cytochrome bd-type quinol oxidase subunit 1 [Nocardiopsis sinuspersici]